MSRILPMADKLINLEQKHNWEMIAATRENASRQRQVKQAPLGKCSDGWI